MNISYQVLKNYLDINEKEFLELKNDFLDIGIEVDNFEKNFNLNPDHFVPGKILSVQKVKNSDKLNLCEVLIKNNSKLKIICGASNVKPNTYVIVALINSVISNNIVIKKRKIFGHESEGMICSLSELGIASKFQTSEELEGIYVFNQKVTLNDNPLEKLNLLDLTYKLELTSNRHDLNSIYNLANEISVFKSLKLKPYPFAKNGKLDDKIDINISSKNCLVYQYLIIKDIKCEESPLWLKNILFKYNIRSINNIVDLTNLIMLELNQPLHAYDLDIIGNKLLIVDEKTSKKTKVLDESEINCKDLTIIKNQNDILCLAGITGCKNSSISNKTKNILLEAALWNPKYVLNATKQIKFNTQASNCFSKPLPHINLEKALLKFIYYCQELNIIEGYSKIVVVKELKNKKQKYILDANFFNKIIGTNLKIDFIYKILKQKFSDAQLIKDSISITVPEHRLDLNSKATIVEEFIKQYGVNKIPSNNLKLENNYVNNDKSLLMLKNYFTNLNFTEIKTSSLASKDNCYKFNFWNYYSFKISNPLTINQQHYRVSLCHALLEVIKHNFLKNNFDFNFFEQQDVYHYDVIKHKVVKQNHLVLGLTSSLYPGIDSQLKPNSKLLINIFLTVAKDFYNISNNKFIIKTLKNNEILNFYNSFEIYLGSEKIAVGGEINKKYFANDLKTKLNNVYYCEISLSSLKKHQQKKTIKQNIPVFNPIYRDISFYVNNYDEFNSHKLISDIYVLNKLIANVYYYDVYKEKNKVSLTLRVTIQPKDKNLTHLEINKIIAEITQKIINSYNLKIK